jgi:ubiquinone/menaquinone biosynthesis C-methylase UbiE
MQRFWDERARENAYYFVDDRVDYRHPNIERFWKQGEADLDLLLSVLGLELRSTDTVVEIGCGVGRLTRVLAQRTERVIALDISEEMLNLARGHLKEFENVELVHGDGGSLAGIDDDVASACVSHVVFQHVPEPAIVLGYVTEMGRVLRSGGWSGFQISNDPSIHHARKQAAPDRVLARLGRAPQGRDDPAWLGTAVDLEELETVATNAGMSVERTEGRGTQFCAVALRKAHAG